MNKQTKEIFDNMCREYGEPIFRCGVTHLVDVGARNLTEENVMHGVEQIKKADAERTNGFPIMTAEFQIAILECAAKLAQQDIWDIVRYIKQYIPIG